VAGQFDLVLASFGAPFSSFPEGEGLCADLYLDGVAEIFGFVLAALGSAFASFANSTDAEFEFDGGDFLELESFFENSLFVFTSFGPATSPVFHFVVGTILVVFLYQLLSSRFVSFIPMPIFLAFP
jgi:hypothetical protein